MSSQEQLHMCVFVFVTHGGPFLVYTLNNFVRTISPYGDQKTGPNAAKRVCVWLCVCESVLYFLSCCSSGTPRRIKGQFWSHRNDLFFLS